MTTNYCQFILAVILLAQSSCSWRQKPRLDDSALLSRVEPAWFARDKNLRLATSSGEPQPHLFYDALPDVNPAMSHVNFIPLHVAGQETAFELNVQTGQRYFSHFMCTQPDAWRKRGTVSGQSLFSVGFLPRQFDQLNQPQRVIVFGGAEAFDTKDPVTYRVRLVGAFVEQLCLSGRCAGIKEWIGRLVLVGVYDKDPAWASVKSSADFLRSTDWESVKAQLETLNGHNRIVDERYPAVKVGEFIQIRNALDFLKQHSVSLNSTELAGLHRSCGKVYDLLWRDVGARTSLDRPATSKDDAVARAKLLNDLKREQRPTYFNQRLAVFLQKYHAEFNACARLVYPGNPNENYEKTSFTHWIAMYTRLHKSGWYYDCRTRRWDLTNKGAEAQARMLKGLMACSVKELDEGILGIPAFLRSLRSITGERWRYVAWDDRSFGSHAKLESWVQVPERSFACKNDKNTLVREKWAETPEGLSWKPRAIPNDLNDSEYIF